MTTHPPNDTDCDSEILAYLQAHPRASDSLAGIVSWWLPDQFAGERDLVQASLDRLVAKGLVERTRLADGTMVYGRPRNGMQQ